MGKYDHINFVPPASVAKAAEKGLKYRQKAGDKGGLSTSQAKAEGVGSGVQRAVNLKNRDEMSPDTVKRMKAFFDRHKKNKSVEKGKEPYEDKGKVAWMLWGGDPGYAWAKKVVMQMEAADKKEKIKRAGTAARVILSFYKSCMAESQLEMGIDIEREHDDVYAFFKKHLEKHDVDMPVDRGKFYEMIAKAHIKELPDYYTKLKEMEGNAHKEAGQLMYQIIDHKAPNKDHQLVGAPIQNRMRARNKVERMNQQHGSVRYSVKPVDPSSAKIALDFTSIAPLLTPKEGLDDRELARALRLSIAAELDAIHLYELMADSTDDERVKNLMKHVADEEKVHVGEFQKMLDDIDKENVDLREEGIEEAEDSIKGK